MVTNLTQSPLVVVVGQTASGKSELAMRLAKKFNGEIIAADSRTVYRGMDIGTAKPSQRDRTLVPHHLIDLTEPGSPITVADFKVLALKAIKDIAKRDKLPILVGGSGLYVDAVIFDYSFRGAGNLKQRQKLQALSVEELQKTLTQKGIPLPNNEHNARHLIRSLATNGIASQRHNLRDRTLVIGREIDRDTLKDRIAGRTGVMFTQGLEQEVVNLTKVYGWDIEPLHTIGYQEWQTYFKGEQTLDQTRATIIRNTISYAKRQRTWFNRNKSIHWVKKQREAVDLVTTLLNK